MADQSTAQSICYVRLLLYVPVQPLIYLHSPLNLGLDSSPKKYTKHVVLSNIHRS